VVLVRRLFLNGDWPPWILRLGVASIHISTYPVDMKNVTIALDESLLREARRIAAERSTTLNAMIREYLQELAERESQAAQARLRIVELCRETRAEVGPRTWTRDELHEG
jgi:hypothetical protein